MAFGLVRLHLLQFWEVLYFVHRLSPHFCSNFFLEANSGDSRTNKGAHSSSENWLKMILSGIVYLGHDELGVDLVCLEEKIVGELRMVCLESMAWMGFVFIFWRAGLNFSCSQPNVLSYSS